MKKRHFDKLIGFITSNPFILFFTSFVISTLLYTGIIIIVNCFKKDPLLRFDDADKNNLIQIGLFAAAISAVWEALKARKDTIKLFEAEYQPILAMFKRIGDENTKRWKYLEYGFYKTGRKFQYLAVRNVGKGTAFNVNVYKILDNQSEENKLNIEKHSEKVIPPGSEIAIKFKQEISDVKNLNNTQYFVEACSAQRKSYWYRFVIRDIERGYIEFIKMAETETAIAETNLQ